MSTFEFILPYHSDVLTKFSLNTSLDTRTSSISGAPTNQDKPNNPDFACKVSSPHAKTKASESTSLPQDHLSRVGSISRPQSTNDTPQTADQPVRMAPSETNPIADPKSTNDIPATADHSATMPRPQPNTAAIEALGQILSQVFEEATDLASLKNRMRAAERDFKLRNHEFNQWRKDHEKFPTMEEAQKRNKDSAKKALSSIEHKYAEKDADAKAKIRQVAECLFLSGVGSNDQDKQELQSKVEALENTTQSLVKQLQEHQLFIEKQRTEQLAELEVRDTNIQKLQNELATLRNTQGEFIAEIKPRLDEAHRNASKSIMQVERVGRFESNLASLSAKIPENFEVSFQTITDKVDKLNKDYQSSQNRAIEDPTSNTTKATLVNYGQRLEKVENQFKSGIGPLNTHVTSIIKEQNKIGGNLNAAIENIDSLLGRVTSLEGQDPTSTLAELRNEVNDSAQRLSNLPSNVELTELRKKLAYAESATTKVQTETNDTKKRLEIVEKRYLPHYPNDLDVSDLPHQNRDPSTPADLFNWRERLACLEKSLDAVKNQAGQSIAIANASTPTPAPEIYESLKNDIVAVVTSMQSNVDTEMGGLFDGLSSALTKVKNDVDNVPNNYVPLSSFTPITMRLDDISASVDLLTKNGRNQAANCNNWAEGLKANLVNLENILGERVDVVTHGIVNVEKRLNNINTKEMAMYILNQMDSTYPNLRSAETTLEHHKAALGLAEIRFTNIDEAIQKLATTIHTGASQYNQALREEVDDLQNQVANAKKLAKEAKDAVNMVLKPKPNDSGVLAEQLAAFRKHLDDLTEWKARQERERQNGGSPAKAAGRNAASTPVVDRASAGRGLSFVSTTSLQSSGEPLSKRRRQNGLAPPKSNGIHASPDNKKRKRAIGERGHIDDTDDPEFEPDPPTISDGGYDDE